MAEKQKVPEQTEEHRLVKYASFFSRNKWRVAAAAALVAAVLLVIGLLQFSQKRKTEAAFQAHLLAETPKDYQQVERDFPDTFYGAVSLIEAGNLLFKEEKFAEARRMYLRFLESRPESRLRAWVYNLVGATFEAEGKFGGDPQGGPQAIEYYKRAEGVEGSPVKFQAKLNIGRCYELKGELEEDPQRALDQYATARTYYRQLAETASPSPGAAPRLTPWESQAQERMRLLGEKERKARERSSEKKVDKLIP